MIQTKKNNIQNPKSFKKKENDRKRLGPSDSTTFISAHPSGQRLGTPTVGLNTMALAIEGDTSTKPGKKNNEAGMEKKTKLFLNGIYLVIYPCKQ